jgi:hypothetical protein
MFVCVPLPVCQTTRGKWPFELAGQNFVADGAYRAAAPLVKPP